MSPAPNHAVHVGMVQPERTVPSALPHSAVAEFSHSGGKS